MLSVQRDNKLLAVFNRFRCAKPPAEYQVAESVSHLQLWHIFEEDQRTQVITPKSVLRHSQQRQVRLKTTEK
jgi:hypothetical protein